MINKTLSPEEVHFQAIQATAKALSGAPFPSKASHAKAEKAIQAYHRTVNEAFPSDPETSSAMPNLWQRESVYRIALGAGGDNE